MVATAPNPGLPTLPRETRQRLIRYFALQENLELLAAEIADPDTDLITLQSWAASPDIAPHIDFHRKEAQHRRRERSLLALEEVLAKTEDLIERRRAASSILRALNQSARSLRSDQSRGAQAPGVSPSPSSTVSLSPRSSPNPEDPDPEDLLTDAEDDAADDAHDPSPLANSQKPIAKSPPPSIPEALAHKPGDIDPLPHAHLPDPARTPQDILALTLLAIQNPDHPDPGTGPQTLFNLKGIVDDRSPRFFAKFTGDYLRNVIPHAWGFDSAERLSLTINGDRADAEFKLSHRNGTSRILKVELRYKRAGTFANCWLLGHFGAFGLHPPDSYDSG